MSTWVMSAAEPLTSGSAAGRAGPAPENAPPARTGGPPADAHERPGAVALPHSRFYMGPTRSMPRETWESGGRGQRRGGEGRGPPRGSLRPRPNETLGAARRCRCRAQQAARRQRHGTKRRAATPSANGPARTGPEARPGLATVGSPRPQPPPPPFWTGGEGTERSRRPRAAGACCGCCHRCRRGSQGRGASAPVAPAQFLRPFVAVPRVGSPGALPAVCGRGKSAGTIAEVRQRYLLRVLYRQRSQERRDIVGILFHSRSRRMVIS